MPPRSLRKEDADVAIWLFKGPSGPHVWDQLQDTTETKLMIWVPENERETGTHKTHWEYDLHSWLEFYVIWVRHSTKHPLCSIVCKLYTRLKQTTAYTHLKVTQSHPHVQLCFSLSYAQLGYIWLTHLTEILSSSCYAQNESIYYFSIHLMTDDCSILLKQSGNMSPF